MRPGVTSPSMLVGVYTRRVLENVTGQSDRDFVFIKSGTYIAARRA